MFVNLVYKASLKIYKLYRPIKNTATNILSNIDMEVQQDGISDFFNTVTPSYMAFS
jgi:hypothetical protein